MKLSLVNAAIVLKLAKKKTIPAIVRKFDESQMMEVAVLENLQREDLTP